VTGRAGITGHAPIACKRCGRALRSARSVAAGRGRTCQVKARAEAIVNAIAPYTEAQQAKALDLLASGGLRQTPRPAVWLADSSDKTTTYTVQADTCSCPSRCRCYHQAARSAAIAVLALTLAA
jgi:Family of unknown function (DUF6011)